MLTKAELQYMTRVPNEIRRLSESIENLAEAIKPISEACKNHPGINVDPQAVTDILNGIEKIILKHK